jgi:hypothetical protein
MPVQPLVVQFWNGAAWNDQLTYSESSCTVARGTDGESGLRPSKYVIDLNNDDDRYDITNPMSPLYGVAKRNIRTRVRVNAVTQTQAEASAYRPERTIDHVPGASRGMARCSLTAEGVLRRVLQWETPLHSPIYRFITGTLSGTLAGYWPMEDGRGARQLTNALAGGQPGAAAGVTFAVDQHPGGSDNLMQASLTTVAAGAFTAGAVNQGWQFCVAVRLPAIPAAIGFLSLATWYTSDGNQWTLDVDDNEYRFTVRNASTGAILLSSPSGFGTGAEPNQWIFWRIKASISAGTVTVEPSWYPEGAPVLYGVTTTFAAASLGYLTRWRITGNVNINGAWYGHLYAVKGVTDDLQTFSRLAASNGHPGELAANRFLRLCDEEKINRTLVGSASTTMPMGVQRPATFRQLLDEIIATEDALIYDQRLNLGLEFQTRNARYTQAPALAMNFPTHVVGYDKIIDDLGVKNLVTISQANGGEYVAELKAGALSTLASPAGIGEAKETYNVNVSTETALPDLGSWYLSKGTIDRARYASIMLDLLAQPGLIAAVEGIEPGKLITISGLEKQIVPLIVVGVVQKIGHVTRTAELTCLPADVYDIMIWDIAGERWGALTTTTAGNLTATDTSVAFTSTDPGDSWLTTGMPFPIVIGGERMTLTAMTAAAGGGPYTQTGTVVRSVNGVVKTHAAGSPIQVADVARWGL